MFVISDNYVNATVVAFELSDGSVFDLNENRASAPPRLETIPGRTVPNDEQRIAIEKYSALKVHVR